MTTHTDNFYKKNLEDNAKEENMNEINNANVVETVVEENKNVDDVVNVKKIEKPHADEDNSNADQKESNLHEDNTQDNVEIVAKEAEMNQNLWEITIKSLQMGAGFCVSKFSSDSDCLNVKKEIQSLLDSAAVAYSSGDRDSANSYLRQAETLYSTIDAKLEASRNNNPNVDNDTKLNQTTTKERTPTIVSYEITYKGDEHDVRELITRAKKALDSGKLDLAERLLLKAEGIFTTVNARELFKKVEEAKAALNAPAQVDNKIEEENFAKRDEYIRKAYKEIAAKNFEEAKRLLNEAEKLDPKLNVKDALSMVEDAIYKNRAINNLIEFAQEALHDKDYEEAHKNIIELQKLDPKKNVDKILLRIKEGLAIQKKAKLTLEKARKHVKENKFDAAEKCITEAINTDPDLDVSEVKQMLQDAMETQKQDPSVEEASAEKSKKETSTLVKILKFVAGVTGVAAVTSYIFKKSSK